jgi:hypothetical protein
MADLSISSVLPMGWLETGSPCSYSTHECGEQRRLNTRTRDTAIIRKDIYKRERERKRGRERGEAGSER